MNMEIINADKQRDIEINNLLQKIKGETRDQKTDSIFFPIFTIYNGNEFKQHGTTILRLKELKKMGAVEFNERTEESILNQTNKAIKNKIPTIAEGYWVKPLEPKFSQLCKEYERKTLDNKKLFAKKEKSIVQSFWITKNKNGIYSYDGNNVYIKSIDADYAVIFDVIYLLVPQGGKIEYDKIIEQCKKRKKKINKKSILRALTGKDANLFRYVEGLKQEPMFNISLFVAMKNGKEIEFNNKK